jgi:hypothetical protein
LAIIESIFGLKFEGNWLIPITSSSFLAAAAVGVGRNSRAASPNRAKRNVIGKISAVALILGQRW